MLTLTSRLCMVYREANKMLVLFMIDLYIYYQIMPMAIAYDLSIGETIKVNETDSISFLRH